MKKIQRCISWIAVIVVVVAAMVVLACPASASKISMADTRAALCAGGTASHDFGAARVPCVAFHSAALNRLAAVIPAGLDLAALLAIAVAVALVIGRWLTSYRHAVSKRWRFRRGEQGIIKYLSGITWLRWFARLGFSGIALSA